ncbi:MAG TPA: WXG100 family type VII secretion target [Ktedonobacteraceae bacterium]|jgi:WXG100 family type VII secretion target|nr:WXG100 family type VII secretion target [Ktedonobacteraceae bacterium]
MAGNNGIVGGNIEGMQGSSKTISGSVIEGFVSQLQAMNAQVQSLEGEWYGKSSTAFQGAANNWNKNINSMISDLRTMASIVNQTAGGLSDVDTQGAAALSGFEG